MMENETKEEEKAMDLPTGKLYITYGLIAVNVLVFLLMAVNGVDVFQPKAMEVLKWGASFPPMTLNGDWWRTFTCMFLHFGIIHLALNMYALYYVGTYLEPMLGKRRYLVAYLCSGLAASMLSLFVNKNDYITSAGASGAVFGMFGVFLALLTTNIIPKDVRKALLQSILVFVGYNVFYGFVKGSGIDNAAHIGGLLSGMLIGYIYSVTYKEPTKNKTQIVIASVVLATALGMFVFFSAVKTLPATVDYKTGEISSTFYDNYKQFGEIEKRALAPEEDSVINDAERVHLFETTSVPSWEEAGKIVDAMKTAARAEKEVKMADALGEYIALRKELVQLKIKAIKENTSQYNGEQSILIERINKLLEKSGLSE